MRVFSQQGIVLQLMVAMNMLPMVQSANLNYRDSIFLRIENQKEEWLTGARSSDETSVYTKNIRGSDNEIRLRRSYQWSISATGDDAATGSGCLKYGDKFYLKNENHERRWLSGSRSHLNQAVITEAHADSYSRNTVGAAYRWMVRSNLGRGSRSGEDDSMFGKCVQDFATVYIQNDFMENRWLSGNRSGDSRVLTLNQLSSSYEQTPNIAETYVWSMRTSETKPITHPTYFFDYSFSNLQFGDFNEAAVEMEPISTAAGGHVANCASGSTTVSEIGLALSTANSQSLTVSKSFTSESTKSITAGVSVTATASANAIFASASASTTASFEYSNEWTSSATEEESTTLEKSDSIEFFLSTSVEVEPMVCVDYALTSDVSREPTVIPYTADVTLTVFANENGYKGAHIRHGETLAEVSNLMAGYDAKVDFSEGTITYEVSGLYSGVYATKSRMLTFNCDECEPIGFSAYCDKARLECNF